MGKGWVGFGSPVIILLFCHSATLLSVIMFHIACDTCALVDYHDQ